MIVVGQMWRPSAGPLSFWIVSAVDDGAVRLRRWLGHDRVIVSEEVLRADWTYVVRGSAYDDMTPNQRLQDAGRGHLVSR